MERLEELRVVYLSEGPAVSFRSMGQLDARSERPWNWDRQYSQRSPANRSETAANSPANSDNLSSAGR